MTPTRRHFLRAFAAAATMKAASARGRTLREIGLQLYTIRDLLSADFEGTLREIARLGYQEVEFAGRFNSWRSAPFFFEHDHPSDPIQSIKTSISYLRQYR